VLSGAPANRRAPEAPRDMQPVFLLPSASGGYKQAVTAQAQVLARRGIRVIDRQLHAPGALRSPAQKTRTGCGG